MVQRASIQRVQRGRAVHGTLNIRAFVEQFGRCIHNLFQIGYRVMTIMLMTVAMSILDEMIAVRIVMVAIYGMATISMMTIAMKMAMVR